jgi:hypothetical protein
MRGTKLLEALLPVAAHLVPLPADADDLDSEEELDMHDLLAREEARGSVKLPVIDLRAGAPGNVGWGMSAETLHDRVSIKDEDNDDDEQLELIKHLELGGLELIVSGFCGCGGREVGRPRISRRALCAAQNTRDVLTRDRCCLRRSQSRSPCSSDLVQIKTRSFCGVEKGGGVRPRAALDRRTVAALAESRVLDQ